MSARRLIEEVVSAEDLLSPGLFSCMGCTSELGLRIALKVFGKNTVLVTAPGCIAGIGVMGYGYTTGVKVPSPHALFDNVAAMMSGISRQLRRAGRGDLKVVCYVGDGATCDIGFQCLSAAIERGENMIYICYDNEGYMNTGIQRSGTTPYGARTTTTPVGKVKRGKEQESKYLPLIIAMHRPSYVATATPAFMHDYILKLRKCMEINEGVRYIHLLTPCPTGWGFPPEKSIEISRLAVLTGYFPLWEVEKGRFRFTVKVKSLKPIEDFIRMMGRFAHLTKDDIIRIETTVKRRYKFLEALSELPSLA